MKNYSYHIRKRERRDGKGAYQIVVEIGKDENGKRIRRYETASTKKEANNKALQIIEDLNREKQENGCITGKGKVHITVKEWAFKWLDTFCVEDSETTKARYRDMIEKDIVPKIGSIGLNELACVDVQTYLNGIHAASPRTGEPLSGKTVKNIYHILNSMMKKAVQNGDITKNPCDGVTLPKRTPPKTEIYDQEMIQKCLQSAEKTDLYLPLALSFSLGLRRGELLGLKWKEVDLEKGIIHIQDNRVVAGGKVLEKIRNRKLVSVICLSEKPCLGFCGKKRRKVRASTLSARLAEILTLLIASAENSSAFCEKTICRTLSCIQRGIPVRV